MEFYFVLNNIFLINGIGLLFDNTNYVICIFIVYTFKSDALLRKIFLTVINFYAERTKKTLIVKKITQCKSNFLK